MRLSVVIPSYCTGSLIAETLGALVSQDEAPDEIVVVDSSDDDTPTIVADQFPQVKLVHRAEQTLPGDARNIGVGVATGELIGFVDADCAVCDGWASGLRECYADQPGVAASAGPVLLWGDENVVGMVDWIMSTNHLVHFATADAWTRSVSTQNFHIRRQVFEGLGGFPEGLRGNAEVVFARRLTGQYGPARVLSRVAVRHRGIETVEAFLHHQRRYGHGFVAGRTLDPELYGAWALRNRLFLRLAPVARGLATSWRLLRHRPRYLAVLLCHPLLFARGLLSWGKGLREALAGHRLRWLPAEAEDVDSGLGRDAAPGRARRSGGR